MNPAPVDLPHGSGQIPASVVFLLVGPPAVGKLTLARELERRTGAIVVDNHLVNNAVFVPMGMGRGLGVELHQTDALRQRVWDVVVEAAVAAPGPLSHVFTVWLTDDEVGAAHVERLRSLAAQRRARFVPIWLTASAQSLLARVDAPGRAEQHKLTDPEILGELLLVRGLPAPADALRLDLGEITPSQAVDEILTALG